MIEQAADEGVMQRLGRGRILVSGDDCLVGRKFVEQRFEPGVLETGNVVAECAPEWLDIFGGLGKIVGVVDLRVFQPAHLVDSELPAPVILVDNALHFDEVVLLEGGECILHVVPHVALQLPAAVGKDDRQVEFAVLLGLNLLDRDHKQRGDGLVFLAGAIGDVEFLHQRP